VTIDDGHGLHVVTVIRDLTEELQLRDRLIRRERLSAVGELVSGVAHELNNPLQSVLGTIEVLCSEDHPPAIRQDLERAGHEIARAARIIRQLLTFVRKSPVARLISDLNEIVHATVAVRAYELAQANIQVREQYATNPPVVLVNRDEIQQVILNLIMNAQRAMAEANGGGVLLVRTFATGSQVSVEIEDDGPGIAPELKGRMFEPFVTTKTLGTGTGLGLSLAFGIVSAHDGRLELVTRDRGACFRLTLPGAGFPGPPH
jgi:signal transduction histidine kinase